MVSQLQNSPVEDFLLTVHPFRFLPRHLRQGVAAAGRMMEAAAGTVLYRRGDDDPSVWIIISGEVELAESRQGDGAPVLVLSEGRYFGEWEAIFRQTRRYTAYVRRDCRCVVLPDTVFRQALRDSPACAQGFGTVFRHDRGIFAAFDRFVAHVQQQADSGHITMETLLPLYRALAPAIHPGAREDFRLDTAGLLYAVRRLPENITTTFALLLVDEIPPAFDDSSVELRRISSAARRRDVREMMPGKDLVLLRSGRSDLIDLLTCLCLYAMEARKIRERIVGSGMARLLEDDSPAGSSPHGDSRDDILAHLSFSSRESRGLVEVWGAHTTQRLREIVRHREMFSVHLRRQRRTQTVRRGEVWTAAVAAATRELTGGDPVDLPQERGVHIVSSNAHSVTNCLNPWFHRNAPQVLEWAASSSRETRDAPPEGWEHQMDRLYSLARAYFLTHEEDHQEALRTGERAGQVRVQETAGTGIQVQLIDLSRLAGQQYDPHVLPVPAGCRDIIVNIDYAFGQQAEFILRNLMMLFGRSIRSINCLGKAGALVGQRGDILVPTAFVEQQTDNFLPVAREGLQDDHSCCTPIAGRDVHHGALLTVEGTLLQNRRMLTFYREIWDVVGMEMEGMHYYRKFLEFQELEVIPRDIPARFMYYVSDLPLMEHAGLTAPLATREGVPPLYGITRTILNGILSGGAP